ncbi:MAG TPA: carboxymuconolactone decarboxylase family protein [Terriglobia bacterium]|nr:carboxymuconolactone decarboxylase family protein [Terriglobia bacterium]
MHRLLCALMLCVVEVSTVPPAALAQEALPRDVDPDSRSRLPVAPAAGSPAAQGVAAIRLHGSGATVRWESSLGRALTELAILTSAREHDQPYEWSLHEMEAIAVGLDPAVIDTVRHRKPLTGIGEKESAVIQAGREIFGTHKLSLETYARALKVLGRSNLVDIVDLMANYAATATRLSAFNQQMPPGWKQFLPLPFTPSDDIYPDSRSRLPLIRSQAQNPATAPGLYTRNLAPEGTGPAHIRRHQGSRQSLESSVGRRLMELAVLMTAREHDAQYDWTMHELAALKDGLEPAIIDLVRHRKPPTGLTDKDAILIEFGRELFRKHNVSPQTYARALKIFGERDLVDLIDLMAQHAGDTALLAAFDQHVPAGQKPLLPIP